ncbi:MAG: hypothetical protein WA760_18935, partial [Pseudolabrys sp.]
MPIDSRACAREAMQNQHRFGKVSISPKRRQHGKRSRKSSHRTPMPDGMTRHCQSSPVGPWQALDTVSKRDPAATFNRYILVDGAPLTWSNGDARELSRCARTERRQVLGLLQK